MAEQKKLTWEDIRVNARALTMPKCAQCPVCDGIYCAGKQPGPGGRGSGSTFKRNVSWLRDHVKLEMRVLGKDFEPDTRLKIFGRELSMPIMAAPIGMIEFSYTDSMNDFEYDDRLLTGLEAAGTMGFTGGGLKDEHFRLPLKAVERHSNGIPTIKPWSMEKVRQAFTEVEKADPAAFAMDVDSAGLAHSVLSKEPNMIKSPEELCEIAWLSDRYFIVKGIMNKEEAVSVAEAGCYGIVVSNHGGRVIEDGLSTAEVLPEISDELDGRIKILADGGVRSGTDVFKMLALGADAVLVGRPFATAVIGAGSDGAEFLANRLRSELAAAMKMTGCRTLRDITRDRIRIV